MLGRGRRFGRCASRADSETCVPMADSGAGTWLLATGGNTEVTASTARPPTPTYRDRDEPVRGGTGRSIELLPRSREDAPGAGSQTRRAQASQPVAGLPQARRR